MPTKYAKTLTIPVENFNREFDAKLLLACFAAERKFSVIIGAKKEMHLNLHHFPQSIYIGKSLTERNLEIYEILKKLGHFIVCADEEAVVHYSKDHYYQTKIGPRAFQKVDALFAWGPDSAQLWKNHEKYQGAPIHITGNPRVDLLLPELQGVWNTTIQTIKDRYGEFILINTNFGKLNNFRPEKSEHFKILKGNPTDFGTLSEFEAGRARHKYQLFQEFQNLPNFLAQHFPNLNIVIRPHPSEDPKPWADCVQSFTNVHVNQEGNVIPWMLAATATIQNGCTTGVEGFLLGIPVIAFQPITSSLYDLHLPNNLSISASDLNELKTIIEKICAKTFIISPEDISKRKRLSEQFISIRNGRFSCEEILQKLEIHWEHSYSTQETSLGKTILGKAQSLHRKMTRQYNALVKRNSREKRKQRKEYQKHIFPDIQLEAIQQRIQIFSQTLNRFQRVTARKHSERLFTIQQDK